MNEIKQLDNYLLHYAFRSYYISIRSTHNRMKNLRRLITEVEYIRNSIEINVNK